MKHIYSSLTLIFIGLLCTGQAYATHIRAGEIIAKRLSPLSLKYQFTLVLYTDDTSPVPAGGGKIDFGDGSGEFDLFDIALSTTKESLGENISLNTFVLEHTYPFSSEFKIRYREFNRNPNSRTMINSVNTPFYIETSFIIDAFFGLNNTPQLLVPPVDKAAIGATFLHNPGAYDADGDSLAYKLVENKQDIDLSVNGFKFPNDQTLYEGVDYATANQAGNDSPTFTLDPITGDLVWDAPGVEGEYNMAFIVEEWRKIGGVWYLLGYVTRDMQVRVEKTDNNPPELEIPNDTCIVAGSLLEEQIFADDPDGHDVRIEAFSGIFELSSSPGTFSPNPPTFQPVRAKLDFSWLPDGTHVRDRPYQVQFRATDKPPLGPALTDIQTWNITVVGPAPENPAANAVPGRAVNLVWDPYKYRNNADSMEIWRRIDSFEFEAENCQIGIPEYAGYELVGKVSSKTNTFNDNNNGEGLNPGVSYCYRLVAVWPQPSGGESYASEEVCVVMEADVPLITNVSIEKSSETDGEILVRWTPPFDIDPANFPPPYTYELVRASGFSGKEDLVSVITTSDTSFVDTGLNTSGQIFNYRVVLYDASNTMVDTSSIASTVRADAGTLLGAIEISWTAEVPWSNNIDDYPYHLIYRDNGAGGPLELIDSVNVNLQGFSYLDQGQYNGIPLSDTQIYCYFVETRGSYGNPKVISPLLNKSQVICAQPNDTVPPCAPVVNLDLGTLEDCESFLIDKSCNFSNFFNTIRWTAPTEEECDDDVRSYNVYYSRTGEEGTFEIISPKGLRETTFVHSNLTSLAGCYRITSVDRSGNESPFSETICNDNCVNFELPNIITPNDDGKNDTFRPMDCPRFVESLTFRVVNRWGKEVFSYTSGGENSIFINWDGKSNDGTELSTGVYYYVAEVNFIRLNPEDSKVTYKGWVHVLR